MGPRKRRACGTELSLLVTAALVVGLAIRHVSSAGAISSPKGWLRVAEQQLLHWSPVGADWTRPWLASRAENSTVRCLVLVAHLV